MSEPAESIIVCEGFHDRAFLSGWLTTQGWQSWKDKTYGPPKRPTTKGIYAFHRDGPEGWLRVLPAGGERSVWDVARVEAAAARTRATTCITVVWDDDSMETEATADASRQKFVAWATSLQASRAGETDEYTLTGAIVTTRLHSLVLQADDADHHELPKQQTLERLVCAALHESDPSRAEYVARWIAGRPSPPAAEKLHKTHAASHMAGWYSGHGYEGFFREIWDDAKVREALKKRLDAIGATRILESLVAPSSA